MKKIKTPQFDIIEETALKFAMVWYEAARNSGLSSKHKTARLWALKNFEKFIPQALNTLMDMLSRNDIAENIKEKVYLAIMERNNDPELQQLFPIDSLPQIDVKKLLDNTPLAPVVIESNKPKRPLKSRLKESSFRYG